MQIEAGKYYRTRDGRKVGPMRNDGHDFLTDDEHQKSWNRKTGERLIRNNGVDDIVAEWTKPDTSPVREVTRREIVDGTYSRVFVYKVWDMPKKVAVAFVKAGEEGHIDTPAFVLDAAELRAAAAVLLELAGALE